MCREGRICIAILAVVFLFSQAPVSAAENKADKEKAPVSKWKWNLSLGADFESSKIDNTIYKPEVSGTYKKTEKAASSFKFSFSDTSYSRTKTKNKYKLDGEWKRKTPGGSLRLKTAFTKNPNNDALDATDITVEGTMKFSKQHSSTLGITYTPSTYAGRASKVESDDEDDSGDESAEETCRNIIETEEAVDDAGAPLTVTIGPDVLTDLTWLEYFYYTELDNLGVASLAAATAAEEEAAEDAAYAEEDEQCALADPVAPGSTRPLTQLPDVKARKVNYIFKHAYTPSDVLTLNFEAKVNTVSLKGTPSQKDRTKDVDVTGFVLGADWDVSKYNKLSLDLGMETGKSAQKNMSVSPDNSYRTRSYKAGFSSKLSDILDASAEIGVDRKKFTTSNLLSVDSNNGRTDKTLKYSLKLEYKPEKNLKWTLGYKKNDVDRRKTANTTKTKTNTLSLAVDYSF